MRIRIGTFGVDSGQVLIGDPCYLRDFKNDEYDGEPDINQIGEFSYSGSCNTTMQIEAAGTLTGPFGNDAAVVASTGYGDGVYEVFATYTDDIPANIAKLEIIFIGESD